MTPRAPSSVAASPHRLRRLTRGHSRDGLGLSKECRPKFTYTALMTAGSVNRMLCSVCALTWARQKMCFGRSLFVVLLSASESRGVDVAPSLVCAQ